MTISLRSLLSLALVFASSMSIPSVAAQDKSGTTAAPFLLLGTDARGTALGGAQVAAATGPEALHWNPAGAASATARAGTGAAVFSSSEWLVESRHNYVGATFNTGSLGTFGLSVTQLSYGDEPVTTIDQPEGTGELYDASDLAVGITYARPLTEQFTFGGTVKLVRQQIWNESSSGAALDLGVRYKTGFRGLTIGMAMTNFGTDMQLSGRDLRRRIDIDPNQSGNNDDLPAELEVNEWAMPLSFNVGVSAEAYRTDQMALTVSAEGQAPSDNSQSASLGAEYSFRDLLYLRGGYRGAFSSVTEDGGWAAGFGLKYGLNERLKLSVDYVFQEVEPFGTPQMFTLGVTF